MNANIKAAELKTRLFNLIAEYKTLQLAVNVAEADFDAKLEAGQQIDATAAALANVYENLGDLFHDAARDPKDQSFAFSI